MSKNASIRLSDKEEIIINDLKKAYNISNTSELLRVLIRKDHENLKLYEGLTNLSDKQIISLNLHSHCSTKINKEVK